MKEYKFLVTVYEGNDEWWELLNGNEFDSRIGMIQNYISEILNQSSLNTKVENKNYYQLELPL